MNQSRYVTNSCCPRLYLGLFPLTLKLGGQPSCYCFLQLRSLPFPRASPHREARRSLSRASASARASLIHLLVGLGTFPYAVAYSSLEWMDPLNIHMDEELFVHLTTVVSFFSLWRIVLSSVESLWVFLLGGIEKETRTPFLSWIWGIEKAPALR